MTTSRQATASGLEVRPLKGRRDLDAFLRLPWGLYGDDPAWVPPLLLERRLHLSPRNPYFRHAQWQAWLALRDGRPVGRISAQIDELHRQLHGSDTGHFGLGDQIAKPHWQEKWIGKKLFEDTDEVLFRVAEEWLAARGTRRVTGPFNLSINQESGLLVDGFEHPPSVMMPHNRSWYGSQVERQGYAPAKDLLAYRIRADWSHPRAVRATLRRYRDRIRVRPLERRRLRQELATLRRLFNDGWAGNWGFVPFTQAEFDDLGQTLKLLVDDEFIQIAELDGQPAAFIVALPNLNEAIRDLDGRLLPFGWARLLWRLKRRRIRSARVALMGVERRHQRSPVGSALALSAVAALQRPGVAYGIEDVELSWILEDNTGMRAIIENIGSELYKRYRLYQKALD